jgi:hypothetical protein
MFKTRQVPAGKSYIQRTTFRRFILSSMSSHICTNHPVMLKHSSEPTAPRCTHLRVS